MAENIPVAMTCRTSTLYGVMNGETREIFVRLTRRAAEGIIADLPGEEYRYTLDELTQIGWNVCLLTRID